MSLRDYQVNLKNKTHEAWASGHKNVLNVLPCGGGKTKTMATLAAELDEPGVIQAHREELVTQIAQALAREGVPHRIIGPEKVAREAMEAQIEELGRSWVRPDAAYGVASTDTLIRRQDPWFDQVKHWQTDECFPAGTLVDGRPIETIQIGDLVTAFDEQTAEFVQKPVVRLFKNPMPEYMVRLQTSHGELVCTPSHPIWTNQGWKKAYELQLLWRANSQKPQDVLGRMSPRDLFADSFSDKQNSRIRKDDQKQPHDASRVQRQNDTNAQGNRPQAEEARWQRGRNTTGRTSVNYNLGAIWLCLSTRDCDKSPHQAADNCCGTTGTKETKDITISLQSRHGPCYREDHSGSGRQQSFNAISQSTRSQERWDFIWVRLENCEVFQSGDLAATGDGFVYNLEVADLHTYTANGIVVHNCHHLLATNKWGRAVGLLGGAVRGIGWTATPCRLDRKSLRRGEGGMFDVMNIGPGMRELIKRGYLKDYRIYGLPQSMDISNVRTTSGGEFNQADLHDAAAKSTITGDIVKHAIALAPGKRGVTFAIDVPMATEHAQAFRDAGVRAAVLSSYTPAGERAQIIRAYRGDGLQEVVNVDVLGEGFDLPGIVRASFARPTQSLGLYIQQFGRPLRPCEGEEWGIICDHVGNVPRHGLPDKPRQWSLDAPPPREKGEIPVRVCGNPECMRDYEGFSRVCPHCGWQPIYTPTERQRPEVLEGDLTLYAPELLAALRAEVERIAGPADIPYGASPKIAAAVEKRWRERGAAQSDLAGVIDLWAGQWHHGRGEPLDAVYRRFWATFGMDTYTALSMSGPKQREMIERVRANI